MAKILLVEDDTNLSEIYQARMEAEGYEVVTASDGESALALAAKEKPDLVISDVMMPKISGFEMLDILRNTDGLKNTPVIMLTALGQSDDKDRAESLGADRYLVKSQVTLEDIVNAAHSLLEGEARPQPSLTSVAAAPVPTADQPPTSVPAPIATDNTVAVVPDEPAPTGPLTPTEPAAAVLSVAAPEPPVTPVSGLPVIPLAVAPANTTTPQADQSSAPPPTADTPNDGSSPNDTPLAAKDAPASENFTTAGNSPAPSPIAAHQPPLAHDASLDIVDIAQTTAQESASVNDKIVGFAHRPVAPVHVPPPTGPVARNPGPDASATPAVQAALQAAPPVAPIEPQATAPSPATVPTAAPASAETATATAPAPPTAASIDEKVVAKAIDQLLTIQAAPPQAAPPPEHGRVLPSSSDAAAPQSSAVQDDRPQKKVISPISRPAEATLEELLAREEAREEAIQIADDAASRQLYDPASQPAYSTPVITEQPPEAAIPTQQVPTQQPADVKMPPFDPNSISL